MRTDRPEGPRPGWACLAIVLLLGGCALAPEPARLALPVAATYPVDAGISGSIAGVGWRNFFPEPQLQTLIAEALVNNRDLRVASNRVEEARAALNIREGALYPQVDAVATGTRGRTPADLSLTGQASTTSVYRSFLSAGWELDFWGRLRSLRAAALQRYLATEEGRRGVATSLIAQVASSYLLEREHAERIALARRTVTSRADSLRILRRRYEVGSGSNFEVTQARTLLAQAQSAATSLELDRAVNRNALAVLVGHPITFTAPPLPLDEASEGAPLPAGLPSDLLIHRPDVIAAEHRLQAAGADIGAARAAFFPNISLTGSFGTASSQLEGLFKNGAAAWSFSPTLVLPIFTGGQNRANLDLATARRSIAVAEYERTIQEAFRDVADALVGRRQTAEQIATTEETLTALTERARLAQLRFDNGRSAYLEVLEAQRDLFQTEQSLIQLRRIYLASGVALYAAVGGGLADDPVFSTTTRSAQELPQ